MIIIVEPHLAIHISNYKVRYAIQLYWRSSWEWRCLEMTDAPLYMIEVKESPVYIEMTLFYGLLHYPYVIFYARRWMFYNPNMHVQNVFSHDNMQNVVITT